ncbi:hypothetical protein [Christiangramia portivictoriae]|uniref:hypothetical protein n=1 Tax=Christiangramia portivictoriae TaxID=326069 RepID=UPI0004141171|nr:hypothetical protein [Christiangramia portivictoriae]
MEVKSFKISGHSTKQEWAVYIFVATPIENIGSTKLYVGKVGDNRDGCNPVISRVGNHFSHNKIHSQIRNKIENTEKYNYEYFYCHFGEYNCEKNIRKIDRDRINELERRLNKILQRKIRSLEEFELINIYKGTGYISKKEKERRKNLINKEEMIMLDKLSDKALLPTTVHRQEAAALDRK